MKKHRVVLEASAEGAEVNLPLVPHAQRASIDRAWD